MFYLLRLSLVKFLEENPLKTNPAREKINVPYYNLVVDSKISKYLNLGTFKYRFKVDYVHRIY